MIRELSQLIHEHTKYPLFGILLFTEADPHIIKVLKDPEYYSALDEITGKNLALFATVLFRDKYGSISESIIRHQLRRLLDFYLGGVAFNLKPIWMAPRQNYKVLPWFGIKDSRELPLLVIFGHQNKNFYYQKYPIKAETPEGSFNSLKNVLSRISNSVQKAKAKGKVNKKEIFESAQWEMKKLEAHQRVRDFFEMISMLRSTFGV